MIQLRVLFVEDEPDIRHIVEMAMRLDSHMEFKSFETGVAALEWLGQTNEQFDFALVNLRLPFMTGIEFHERLQKLPGFENIVTALITASVRPSETAAYELAGIAGWISKPFDPLRLAQHIRRIFEAGRLGVDGER
jgi:two-component system, OmpR family, response regulator